MACKDAMGLSRYEKAVSVILKKPRQLFTFRLNQTLVNYNEYIIKSTDFSPFDERVKSISFSHCRSALSRATPEFI